VQQKPEEVTEASGNPQSDDSLSSDPHAPTPKGSKKGQNDVSAIKHAVSKGEVTPISPLPSFNSLFLFPFRLFGLRVRFSFTYFEYWQNRFRIPQ